MSGEPGGGTTGASGDSVTVSSGNIHIGHIGSGNVIIGMAEPATITAVAIFSKAYLEALGRRTEQGVANLSKRVGDLVRARAKRRGSPDEYLIGLGDGATAMIVVTGDTPDEARLALLDLDVTAPELRCKELRWDTATATWRPSELGEATSTE
jgi:hypothetical protein